jgi:RNA-directed DNA polymerase
MLNEQKTSLKNARQERFDFLGYSFGPHWNKANGLRYPGAKSRPRKSAQDAKWSFCLTTGTLCPANQERP